MDDLDAKMDVVAADYQNDDDDSVSSSDTGDDSSTEERVDKAALDAMLDDGDADEDVPLVAPRTKNEIVDQPKFIPPPGPITDNDTLKIVGHITSLHLDMKFAVALGVSNGPPVADGSVLCAADRRVIGRVEEVFGPVSRPYYKIVIPADGQSTAVNEAVYAVEKYSSIVDKSTLDSKGTDASNDFDEELPAEMQEFSDDEEERRANRRQGRRPRRQRNSRQQAQAKPRDQTKREPQQSSTAIPVFPNPFAATTTTASTSSPPPNWLNLNLDPNPNRNNSTATISKKGTSAVESSIPWTFGSPHGSSSSAPAPSTSSQNDFFNLGPLPPPPL